MTTITLPRTKYIDLKTRAEAFDIIISNINPDLFVVSTVKSRKTIMKEFSQTKLYNAKFLSSLGKGLKRSNFFSA